jgi:hypothetical protein
VSESKSKELRVSVDVDAVVITWRCAQTSKPSAYSCIVSDYTRQPAKLLSSRLEIITLGTDSVAKIGQARQRLKC